MGGFQRFEPFDAELRRHVSVIGSVQPERGELELTQVRDRIEAGRTCLPKLSEHLRTSAGRRPLRLSGELSPEVGLADGRCRAGVQHRPVNGGRARRSERDDPARLAVSEQPDTRWAVYGSPARELPSGWAVLGRTADLQALSRSPGMGP